MTDSDPKQTMTLSLLFRKMPHMGVTPMGLLMRHVYFFALAVMVAPAWAAQPEPLPPDVVSYLERSAPCRTPTGSSREEILANLIALLESEKCKEFARERTELMKRYNDNPRVLNALVVKIGFVGNENYEPSSK